MADSTEISYPLIKASAAIGTSAGASALSFTQQAQNFFPNTLSGWLGCLAPAVAIFYSLHLLWDFYWKKVWRPLAERKGWVKPRPHHKVIVIEE